VTGFTNPPIGQALAANGFKQHVGAFTVGNLESRAAVITEIELCQIAVQVSFIAMLINADHAALEDGEDAFNRIGVDNGVALTAGIVLR
jgi:hypothetical protein